MTTSIKDIYKAFEYLLHDYSNTEIQRKEKENKIIASLLNNELECVISLIDASEHSITGNIESSCLGNYYSKSSDMFFETTFYEFLFRFEIFYDDSFRLKVMELNPDQTLKIKGLITKIGAFRGGNRISEKFPERYLSVNISLQLKSISESGASNYSLDDLALTPDEIAIKEKDKYLKLEETKLRNKRRKNNDTIYKAFTFALFGAVAGMFIGTIKACTRFSDLFESPWHFREGIIGTFIGAIIGALIGVIIGQNKK